MKKGNAAYHGGSWRLRKDSHAQDARAQWPFRGGNSEFEVLKEVVLLKVRASMPKIRDVEAAQFLRPVDWKKMARELNTLARAFAKQKVRVRWLDADAFVHPPPNLMFARDHFFITPWGAVLSRMASPARAGEEKWAQAMLAQAGIPILHLMDGRALFEGADALWIAPKKVLVGLGNRTNPEAFRQLRAKLKSYGVKCVAVRLPKSVQHLLGLLQIVGPNTALVRTEIAPRDLKRHLRGYTIHAVPESEEVKARQGMNIVVLKTKHIFMPTNCPELKKLFKSFGLKVVGEIPLIQCINAAGGLACTTGVTERVLREL